MHTVHSDGSGYFDDLVAAARQVGLDFIFVTDHNVLVRDDEEGYRQGILTLVGQEVHDPDRSIPGNHLLCLGVHEDVTHLAADPQELIDAVHGQGGLAFLAHPIEAFTELVPKHFSWHDWEVTGYQGIELWNYMSTFRPHATSKLTAILIGYFPHWFTEGPLPQMLAKWDELTAERSTVAIGGTDVHARDYRIGIFQRCFLPYLHCTQALNTHILTERPLHGPPTNASTDVNDRSVQHDRQIVLDALANGHCWIGYDLLAPTDTFRFQAQNEHGSAIMGDTLRPPDRAETYFSVVTPAPALIRLLHNGRVICESEGTRLDFACEQPGVYRVEVWKRRWRKLRGWIFSNPIYVRDW